jgi:uncharacterized membrane protein
MIIITAVLMLLTLVDLQLSPVRILIAIAMVTILPGYALTSAIFINTPLGIMEKIAFSCGFSLGMTSLGGVLLNYTRWGIQSVSWIVLLGGISLLAGVFALARMTDTPKEVDLHVVHMPLKLHQILLMVLAAAIMSGAYLYARAGAENRSLPPSTRIWMFWTDETQNNIYVGVQNQERVRMQYRLQLSTLNGQVQEWPAITLEPGATWEFQYEMPQNVAENDYIRAALYKLDSPEQNYREVFLRRIEQ